MFYRIAALGAMGTTAYLVTLALSEQFSKTGTYPLLSQCLQHIQASPQITARLTPPLYPSAHPSSNNNSNKNNTNHSWGHRRSHPVVDTVVDQMGREVSRTEFFVEDGQGRYARVYCQAINGVLCHLQVHFPQDPNPIDLLKPPSTSSSSSLLSKYFGIFN